MITSTMQDDFQLTVTAILEHGTSVFGGIGSVAGTVVGVWIPGVLRNGIIILGVQPYWQGIIIGLVLVGTVWFDQYRRRAAAGTTGPTGRKRIAAMRANRPTKSRSQSTHPPTNQ